MLGEMDAIARIHTLTRLKIASDNEHNLIDDGGSDSQADLFVMSPANMPAGALGSHCCLCVID